MDIERPTDAELQRGLENSRTLLLYAGTPNGEDDIEGYKKSGGRIIFFMSPAEKTDYPLKPDESGVEWTSDEAVKRFMFENMHLWIGGQIGGRDPERAAKLAGLLKELVDLHNFDTKSIKVLTATGEPARNMFRNFRHLEDGIPLSRAKGLGKGTTAILVLAGPSLNEQWADLKRIQESARANLVIIVAGRSYRKAMESGVRPDFVVEVEQFQWDDKIWLFAAPPPAHTILCGPATTCPGVFLAWPDQKNIMILTDHNLAQLMGWRLHEDSIDGGNSILHHMFEMACWLGCSTVCLAGADLCYPLNSKETHADGTFHGWPKEIQRQERARQDPLEVPSNDGGIAISSPGYKNFALFLEIQIEKHRKTDPGLKVVNFSQHGQRISGTSVEDIRTWNLPSSPPPLSLPPPSSPPSPSPEASSPTSSSSETTTGASTPSA